MAVPVHSNHGVLVVTTGLTSLSYTLPSGSGDLLVFCVYKENTAAITKPAAATQKSQVANSTPIQQTIFYGRVSDLGAGPYAYSWTGATFAGGSVHRISGAVAAGDPFDIFDHQFSDTPSLSTPAVQGTTTGPDRLLLWLATAESGGSGDFTSPSGFTEIHDDVNQTGARKDQAAAGATGSLTGTNTASDRKNAFLGAILPSADGPGPLANPALLIQRGLWRPWMGGDPATPDAPADVEVPYVISQYGGYF